MYQHQLEPTTAEVNELLANDIDPDSDFGEHADSHAKLKPEMPSGFEGAAADIEDRPPLPVPPPESAGQPVNQIHVWLFAVRVCGRMCELYS